MKKLHALVMLTLTSMTLSCGPSTPQTSPKPSASPSASATPSATPSPIESSVPTPEPTTTPFPSGTPQPSATPLPTPSPVFSSDPVASPGPEVVVQFKARVISASREVLPVVENAFTVNPYPLSEVKASLAIKNNAEAKPIAPSESDVKYQIEEKVCSNSGCSTQTRIDSAAFQKDLSTYQNSILPEWESRAYKGLEDELARLSNGRSSLNFSTDKNGEATVRLQTGKWYFNGRYSYSQGSTVVWEDVMFEVKESTKTIELTR
ncbi:hypothetical protein COW36_08035 [bacterium (Candidatus Blackallbacteria) CG17_big_fil_post_rev_8_21_14_2_50_48_46]|uniref:Uncharacterized protein n=1 Tax=bacterium (Candidatus Blackallbacteria) CG17_big_fil_post_rev_8_21_14_2_50_48_46 TaxID=2014261 RepID=A0A2M7G5Z1_9BACT|nr:MAG: hypothetical protein COW64_24575 [bacterium (Candidatus Blackallbacteria) CG18_big_fil_WC_8_21_14_2_50_49_26]PIW17438.1 MAG: hypothetical protein COW36_08035 [bacterium (Candidatus Blackallbacteria) CG17_big_fil_post_rev_8_21_14_2_50_48_46]PIW48292.1 MAG: hypothetical protein COW20_09390 [bacterium (Candidatus Blackallbacteria) CG13_big_fil_rev_8_21_14_2_50_49_14]